MKHFLQNMLNKNIPVWLSLISTVSAANTIVFEPSLYFSERDSPFYGGIADNTGEGIYLEDFEDQQLNTPFVRGDNDSRTQGTTIRTLFPNTSESAVLGVDGDDGIIDGGATGGDVWTTIIPGGGGPSPIMSFEFEPNEDGNYPLYVGFVITRPNSFFSGIEVCWDDPDGTTIHDEIYRPREWAPPEGVVPGSPLNQRFVGIYHSEGIGSVFMENVNQLDHLQYGYSIPEPSSAMLSLLALSLSLGLRKRR